MRRLFLLVPLALAGCMPSELTAPFDRMLSRKFDEPPGREAPLAAAARVDQVGRQVIAANPFVGGDVSFQCVGSDEPAVFHRDTHSVFVTDTMVNRCQTDGELAAVLCSELAVMNAERRNAARMTGEPLPNVPTGGSAGEMGGIPADQVRIAELGMWEMKRNRTPATQEKPADPRKLALEYLTSAGYKESDLDRADEILKDSSKDGPTVKQIIGPGSAPKWSR
jgi:hypothetical protein